MNTSIDKNRLWRVINEMRGKRVLLLGDPIEDVYHFGRVDRICPEAPVPVFVEDTSRTEIRAGGALNVLHNLRSLGLKVKAWIPTVTTYDTKHRYFVGQHLLFRVDRCTSYEGYYDPFQLQDGDQFDAAVISDYAKGWVVKERCAKVIGLGVPTVVDPKGSDWSKYDGATVVCPNEKEMFDSHCNSDAILQKRGAEGVRLHRSGLPPYDFKAEARRVYDVTGAGDVVTAVMAASLAVDPGLEVAAQLATLAATWSVGTVGTVAVTGDVLRELVECA